MDDKFKKDLEKLLKKNENSQLAIYISKCLTDYEIQTTGKVNPFGVQLQEPIINQARPTHPIPAQIGNSTTTGWSNPFGGTSWGI